jgi:hypothetical protein
MMSTDDLAKQLHDKASRGIVLSAEEQAQLEAWYAEQDQAESAVLGPTSSPQRRAALHTQVETALAQLRTVTQRIQDLMAQNEAMRREISVLQRQLAPASTHEPA